MPLSLIFYVCLQLIELILSYFLYIIIFIKTICYKQRVCLCLVLLRIFHLVKITEKLHRLGVACWGGLYIIFCFRNFNLTTSI